MASELTPQQRNYIRKHTKVQDLDPSETAGELNIVPFLDIVVNLIMFLLMTTVSVIAIAQIDAQLPSLGRSSGKNSGTGSSLNLSVTITDNGVMVAGSGGKLAPGCQTTTVTGTITVPKHGKEYDWAALTKCVAQVKSVPDFSDETQVIVTANPMIEYIHLVNAMDAVRAQGDKELFPDVLLSAGVR
ncbi:MAG: biopolymer transporter ExbD [Myxococcales bacterium]|nr:MAG: biopolymer transporter ExbD [Myxococcales bacterium]